MVDVSYVPYCCREVQWTLARKITWIGIGWRLGRGAPQLLAADPNGPEPKKNWKGNRRHQLFLRREHVHLQRISHPSLNIKKIIFW